MAHLQQTLATSPDHVGAHVNLGALLRARGDRVDAIAHLERALELAPHNAAAHTNLGGLLMQQGNVPVRHIVAPGAMGEYGAKAPNETKAGRAENRRVEVKVLVNKGIAGS